MSHVHRSYVSYDRMGSARMQVGTTKRLVALEFSPVLSFCRRGRESHMIGVETLGIWVAECKGL